MPIKTGDLTHHSTLKISGPDRIRFLQGQLTHDVAKLNPFSPVLTAQCDPKGRVLNLYYLFSDEDHLYLITPSEMIPLTLKYLKQYAQFFKTNIEIETHSLTLKDPVTPWNLMNGMPTVYPKTSGQFLPHEYQLDKLNAISWDRGCYTGQEIIARLHYRGTPKSLSYLATVTSAKPPEVMESIYYQHAHENITCGTILDVCQIELNQYLMMITAESKIANTETLFTIDSSPLTLT